MIRKSTHTGNPDILFFILIYLLLFYGSSRPELKDRMIVNRKYAGDSTPLFFILVFLLLFY